MKNKVYEEFSKSKFDQTNNFNEIMSKIENLESKPKLKLANIAAAVIVIAFIGCITPSIYAQIKYNIQFKEYKIVDIDDVTETGLAENIDMDYFVQDEIGVKIDSLYLTDNHLEVNVNFKFLENQEVDSERFSYGYAIYDENKNIYGIGFRDVADDSFDIKTFLKFLYKDIGVEFDENDIFKNEIANFTGTPNVHAEDYSIVSKIILDTTYKEFPQSQKLFIRIFDLGFYLYDENTKYDDLKVSDSGWTFELNIPERFYNDDSTKLVLKNEIPGVTVNKICVDDIKMRVDLNLESYYKDWYAKCTAEELIQTITVVDEEGVEYKYILESMDENNREVRDFDINKTMLDKKYFIKIKIENNEYMSELIINNE